jgi:hypothetical protein
MSMTTSLREWIWIEGSSIKKGRVPPQVNSVPLGYRVLVGWYVEDTIHHIVIGLFYTYTSIDSSPLVHLLIVY